MNFNGRFTQVISDLVEQLMPALVIVRGHRYGAGAGIVWDADGLILTNNHVVGRHQPIVILQNDGEYESRLIARDPDVDLALLSIDASGLTPLKPAPASPRVGEMVFAFGDKLPVIRSDTPLAPGNSGGPLVNAKGEVVGVNAMIVGGDQSVSIAASVANDFVRKAIAKDSSLNQRAERTPSDVI